ncbi:DUF2958 domain-containing protein [Azospirillum sp. TSO5]|uniref:DUF2958 domain-containing protein n=1 Tax=Azospirillum sp. TSO5 TaxID=716760 RepID=UPI000D65EABB|nr:DUF2958 domain-containing protein [Azospirillum sp. TSO5]
MSLLDEATIARLRENNRLTRTAQAEGRTEPDLEPVVKIFAAVGAATLMPARQSLPGCAIVSEMEADGDTLYGLIDMPCTSGPFTALTMGFGEPELGYASLSEIEAVRMPVRHGLKGCAMPPPYSALGMAHAEAYASAMEVDTSWRARGTIRRYAEAAKEARRVVEPK